MMEHNKSYLQRIKEEIEKDIAGFEDKKNAILFLEKAINPPHMTWIERAIASVAVWWAKRKRCKHVFIPTKYYIKKEKEDWWHKYDKARRLTDVVLYEDVEERRCIKCGIDYFFGRD